MLEKLKKFLGGENKEDIFDARTNLPSKCRHGYTHVYVFADTYTLDDDFLTMLYCFKCETPLYRRLDVSKVTASFVNRLKSEGFRQYYSLDDIREYRINPERSV